MKLTGEVAYWNHKGFGFIKPDFGGRDIFFHSSGIESTDRLDKGVRVSFEEIVSDRNGKPQAIRVRLEQARSVAA